MIKKSECLSYSPVCNGGTGAHELLLEGQPPAFGSKVLSELKTFAYILLVLLSSPHNGPKEPKIRTIWPLKKI